MTHQVPSFWVIARNCFTMSDIITFLAGALVDQELLQPNKESHKQFALPGKHFIISIELSFINIILPYSNCLLTLSYSSTQYNKYIFTIFA